jgi:hypothetical protein
LDKVKVAEHVDLAALGSTCKQSPRLAGRDLSGEFSYGFQLKTSGGIFMPSDTQTAPVSKKMLWTGRIMNALVVLFLLMDGVMKLINPAPVVEGMNKLGYPLSLSSVIGIVLLVCVVVFAIPRTSILGAILLTGYLGGAVASQLRVGLPLFSNVLFPVYMGVLIWGGLFLREPRLRALLPLRS